MRIWLIGVSGMLGSSFANFFRKKKIDFVGTTRKEVDITSKEQVKEFVSRQEMTHIINCAAFTNVDGAEQQQQHAFSVNSLGPAYLAQVGKEKDIHITHFSTDYVFDGQKQQGYDEMDEAQPCNVYGRTKLEGERQLVEANVKHCIIRTSWLFGLHGQNFVSNLLNKMQQHEEINVVSDQMGRPTFCDDLVESAFFLLSHQGIFHFANLHATTWYDFATTIYEKALKIGFSLRCKKIVPVNSLNYPSLAKRPLCSILNTNKYESLLKKTPRKWEEALVDYLEQYFCALW